MFAFVSFPCMIHLALHVLVPLSIAWSYGHWRNKPFWRPFLVMMATMAIDADHLLASPIYDPNRCSIGFHPLHTLIPILIYGLFCFSSKTRWVGVGLLLHMALDALDCL